MDNLLYDLYFVKHNYDGINNLYKKTKLSNNNITKNDVKLWLSKQSTYQQNFSKVEKKNFLPIYSELGNSYQIDLTFYRNSRNKIIIIMSYLQLLIGILVGLMQHIVRIKRRIQY